MPTISSEFLSKEPVSIVAGDTVKFTRSDLSDEFPPASWTLSYRIVGKNGGMDSVAAAEDGNDYKTTITAAVTAKLDAGSYTLFGSIADGAGQRYQVYNGPLEVAADLATVGAGVDTRTYWKIVYDNVSDVIKDGGTIAQQSYSIAGRSLARRGLDELLSLQSRALREVKKEERKAAGKTGGGKIKMRFTKA